VLKTPSLRDILEAKKAEINSLSFTNWHQNTLHAIRRCRTAELGGHIDKCTRCNKQHLFYNSCRNRHCPRCQAHKRHEWVSAREAELLDVPYFHMVFTLPSELNKLALHHPKEVYAALFAASWNTVKTFANNHLNATPGMIAILHTWGQNLSLHPHLHCIIPAGGIDKNGHWIPQRKKRRHLFPVRAMSIVFRAKMLEQMRAKKLVIPKDVAKAIFSKNWVVYAKESFKQPKHVIKYLGNYTHRIAISDGRIVGFDKAKDTVSFRMKDYKNNNQLKVLTFKTNHFIRQFQLHILPKGFTRIRHYGFLSSTTKRKYLKQLQAKLNTRIITPQKPVVENHRICPSCKKGDLVTVFCFGSRGPPLLVLKILDIQNFKK